VSFRWADISRRTAALLLAALFSGLAVCVRLGHPFGQVDAAVNRAAHHSALAHPTLLAAARAVTLLGGATVLVPVAVLTAALLARTDRRRALAVLVLAGGGALVHSLLKVLVGRPRPVFADPLVYVASQAFPSGHATNSTVVYGALLCVVLPRLDVAGSRRLAAVGTAVVVAGIASSRVLLGAHWLTDVVGGVVLGLSWLALFFPTPTDSPRVQANRRSRSVGVSVSDRPEGSRLRPTPSPFAVTAHRNLDPTSPAEVRRVRLGWHEAGGGWRYEDVSRDMWEIICRDCGDTQGPPQHQNAAVRRLRTPVTGRDRALKALQQHLAMHQKAHAP